MSGPQFFETYAGRKFLQSDLPKLVSGVEEMTKAITRLCDTLASNTASQMQRVWEPKPTDPSGDYSAQLDMYDVLTQEPYVTAVVKSLDDLAASRMSLHTLEDVLYYLQGKMIVDHEYMEVADIKHLLATIGAVRNLLGDAVENPVWKLQLSDPDSKYSKQFKEYSIVVSSLKIDELHE